jgi:hypothetical protein
LHGAHALRDREVALGAGVSGTFATGRASEAAQRGRQASSGTGGPVDQAALARGTAVLVAMAPAVAPWVSARLGLQGDNEAGVTYSGRAVRIDARHAFEEDERALSIGFGASWVAAAPSDQEGYPSDTRLDWQSAGVDVPVLIGWRSTAGIVSLWAGARAGFERIAGDTRLQSAQGLDPVWGGSFDVRRGYVAGLVGVGLGFRHLHGALELNATYQSLGGRVAGFDVQMRGVTLAPAAGLVASF